MKHKFKYTLLVCFTLCISLVLNAQTIIKGNLSDISDTTIFVSFIDENGFRDEKIIVKNHAFEWRNNINFSTRVIFSLSKRSSENQMAIIWTEPGILQLKLNSENIKEYSLKGSKLNDKVKDFEKEISQEQEAYFNVIKKLPQEVRALPEDLKIEFNNAIKALVLRKMKYLELNPESYFSAYLLYESQQALRPEEFKQYLSLIKGDALNSPCVKRIIKEFKGEENGSPGKKAHVFTSKDINGNLFDLSDHIGNKTIILDFWASWCVPCRKGNPHLKDLYAKYKDKGLVVICIADNDSSEGAWKKAVNDDGIGDFIHILRGWKGMEYFFNRNDVSIYYGVKTLPTKFLINKEGIIINRYGDGGVSHEILDKDLEIMFGY